MSKQIPSISVFKGGVQVERRPRVGPNSRAIPFVFNEVLLFFFFFCFNTNEFTFFKENCIAELGLNDLYKECKTKPIKKVEKEHEQ